jgi:hypothetical protein
MSQLSDPKLRYILPRPTLVETLAFLRAQGTRDEEGIIFWPARVHAGVCHIAAPIIPIQETTRVSFRIPNSEVFRILREIAAASLVIPIQVHSHPEEACHSVADDLGALVRHTGALSIVTPYWADFPDDAFFEHIQTFRMNDRGDWMRFDPRNRFTEEGT